MLRRLLFVLRMMSATLFYWSPGDWLGFWLGNKSLISLKGITLQLRDGNYMAKIADLAMAWEVIIDNVYDTYPIAPTDTIVDIGGHIGSFSVKASKLAHSGKVFTCEPFPSTFNVLQKNTTSCPNVLLNQIAISNRNGKDTFYFSAQNPAENSLVRKTDNVIEVPLMTLGDFFQQQGITSVDLMKVDCEGAEYDIIFSAVDQLHKIRKLVMEVHEPGFFGIADKYSIDGLMKVLQDSGFHATFKRENKFQGYIYAHR